MARVWKAYLLDADTRKSQRASNASTPSTGDGGGVKIISGNTQKNSGGTVLGGGTPSNSQDNMFNVITSAISGKPVGSLAIDLTTASHGTDTAATGTFAKQTAGNYIMQGLVATLAGEANGFLTNFGASTGRFKGIHKNVTDKDGLQVTRGWEYASGQFTTTPTASALQYTGKDGTTDTVAATDLGATPTRAIPGRLVIKSGAPVALTGSSSAKSYSAITG